MVLWPGGDAYFGAMLNSWIHVMMYSYYALSLLKIRCPWKKYLTMAQLVQFTAVLVYSGFSIHCLPPDGNWRHYLALAIQDAEMISLFMLFLHFWKKKYGKKKTSGCSERSLLQLSLVVPRATFSTLIFGYRAVFTIMPPKAGSLRQRKANMRDAAAGAESTQQRICSLESLKGTEVCVDGVIYDLDGFDHPGGGSILVFGGNDVTVQYHMIHPYHTSKHLKRMKRVGTVLDYECE